MEARSVDARRVVSLHKFPPQALRLHRSRHSGTDRLVWIAASVRAAFRCGVALARATCVVHPPPCKRGGGVLVVEGRNVAVRPLRVDSTWKE